jgi:hypothetical protein
MSFFCEEAKIAAPSAADSYPNPPAVLVYKVAPEERLANIVLLYEAGVAALPEGDRESFARYLPEEEWESPSAPLPTALGAYRHMFWESFMAFNAVKYTAALFNVSPKGSKAEIIRRLLEANVRPLSLVSLQSLRHRTLLVKAGKADPGPSALPLFPPASSANAQMFEVAAARALAAQNVQVPAGQALGDGGGQGGGHVSDDDDSAQELAQRLADELRATNEELRLLKEARAVAPAAPALTLSGAQLQELLASVTQARGQGLGVGDAATHDPLDTTSALTLHLGRLQRTVDTRSVFELSLGAQSHLDKIVTQVSSGAETRAQIGGGFILMGGGTAPIKPSVQEKFNYVNIRQGMDKYLLLHLDSKVSACGCPCTCG